MSGWDRIEARTWKATAEVLPKPWPLECVRQDLRFWDGQERAWEVSGGERGTRKRPGRPSLCERWGWTDHHVRAVMRDVDAWRDPHLKDRRPEISSESPANLQPISRPGDVSAENHTVESPANLQPISSESPHARSTYTPDTPIHEVDSDSPSELTTDPAPPKAPTSFERFAALDKRHRGKRALSLNAWGKAWQKACKQCGGSERALWAYVAVFTHPEGSWWRTTPRSPHKAILTALGGTEAKPVANRGQMLEWGEELAERYDRPEDVPAPGEKPVAKPEPEIAPWAKEVAERAFDVLDELAAKQDLDEQHRQALEAGINAIGGIDALEDCAPAFRDRATFVRAFATTLAESAA